MSCIDTDFLQAAMMVPKALDYTAHLDGLAAVLVALITGLGRCWPRVEIT